MMNRKYIAVFVVLILSGILSVFQPAMAQIQFYKKVELGYLNYRYQTVKYDIDDPNWKGPALNDEQNALGLLGVYGLRFFNDKINTGLGVGYLNFEGTNGATTFGEITFKPLKENFGPFINIRVGYSHIWNQYDNGSNSMLSAFEGGFYYNISDQKSIMFKTGIQFIHEALFLPFSLGFVF